MSECRGEPVAAIIATLRPPDALMMHTPTVKVPVASRVGARGPSQSPLRAAAAASGACVGPAPAAQAPKWSYADSGASGRLALRLRALIRSPLVGALRRLVVLRLGRRARRRDDRVLGVEDRAHAVMLAGDSRDRHDRAEADTADLSTTEEHDGDAAGLVGERAFQRRVAAPRLDTERPHASCHGGSLARRQVGDTSAAARQILRRDIGRRGPRLDRLRHARPDGRYRSRYGLGA